MSTHRSSWVWGHGEGDYSAKDTDTPDVFTFSFTYLPRQLVEECIETGLATWRYPGVDRQVCEVARELEEAACPGGARLLTPASEFLEALQQFQQPLGVRRKSCQQ